MARPRGVEVRRLLRQDRRHRVGGGFPLERALAAEHLVEHRAEREHVGAMIDREAAHLLRRHVAERAQDHAGAGRDAGAARHVALRRVDRLGQTEVEDLDLVVARDHHVLGLEIAMDDAARVRGRNPPGDLQRVGDRAPRRQRAAVRGGRAASRRRTSSVTTNAVPPSRPNSKIDEDVRMREPGDAHRLALEPRQRAGIRWRAAAGEDLDGDLAIEPRIARAVDLAHAAGAERGEDLVGPRRVPEFSGIGEPDRAGPSVVFENRIGKPELIERSSAS